MTSKEVSLSDSIPKGKQEVLPANLVPKGAVEKQKIDRGGLFSDLKLSTVGGLIAAALFTATSLLGWENTISASTGIPAFLITAGSVGNGIMAMTKNMSQNENHFSRLIPEWCDPRKDLHSGEYVRFYGTNWTEIKKPSFWRLINPFRLVSNQMLSQYVSHNLKTDTYSVFTYSGSWFRNHEKKETFLGERGLFLQTVNKMKGIAE